MQTRSLPLSVRRVSTSLTQPWVVLMWTMLPPVSAQGRLVPFGSRSRSALNTKDYRIDVHHCLELFLEHPEKHSMVPPCLWSRACRSVWGSTHTCLLAGDGAAHCSVLLST